MKNKALLLASLILSFSLLTSCMSAVPDSTQSDAPAASGSQEPPQAPANENESDNAQNPEDKPDYLFDARELKEGDSAAGMVIQSIEITPSPNSDEPDRYSAIVQFSGQVTLHGHYIHYNNDEFLGHEISFTVDEDDIPLLPRLQHDERKLWFVFSNHDEAEKAFGAPGSEGDAAVTIDQYQIYYAPSEVWNTAALISVSDK